MAPIQNETLKPKYIDFDMNFKPSPIFTDSGLGASGDILLKTDADAIKQSVSNILQTHRYERPFQHNIDGRTRRLMFEQEDTDMFWDKSTLKKPKSMQNSFGGISTVVFRHEATNAINRFEPRAVGSKIEIKKTQRGEPVIQVQFNTLDTVEEVSVSIKRDR
jgi:phage baseplate assembly protein W